MEHKQVSSILVFGIIMILALSFNAFDLQSKFSAFAQTSFDPYPGPIPENNSTDPATGPIPEGNDTDPTMVPDPLGNSTDMQNPNPIVADTMPGDNMTNPLEDNMSGSLGNTSASSSSPIPTKIGSILPPLEQTKSGVPPKDVQCKQGFTLIIKAEDGSPACVYPQVAQILSQRGW
ncbi:MAG TPA: hypothetical protein VFA69_05230 [Candidatus Nitrosotalea sp.]|nr:hypothetical protein [Candidatus Nitrosotalea sp.]